MNTVVAVTASIVFLLLIATTVTASGFIVPLIDSEKISVTSISKQPEIKTELRPNIKTINIQIQNFDLEIQKKETKEKISLESNGVKAETQEKIEIQSNGIIIEKNGIKKEIKLVPVKNQRKPCDYYLFGQITEKWKHPDYEVVEKINVDCGAIIETSYSTEKNKLKVGDYITAKGRLDAFFMEDPTKLLENKGETK